MNLLDLLLLFLVVLAAFNGYRLGILARGASWIGLALGLLLSLATVPMVLRWLEAGSAGARLLLGAGTLIVTTSLVAGIADVIGLRLRRAASGTAFGPVDRLLGSVAGGVSVLAIVWLLSPAAAVTSGLIAQQVRESQVVQSVREIAPEPPNAMQALRPLIDQTRFPEVFDDLRPAPDLGPPPAQIPVPQAVVDRVVNSTVNVEATGCGRVFEGSGWTAAANTVVTNAHVVAGADSVRVLRPDGVARPATVVVFDDDRDLAVLQVEDLGQQPLPLGEPVEGLEGAETGYPGGQDQPRTVPTRVTDIRTAIGRDIYSRDRTERSVLFLAASLRQGDSGAPVYDQQGTVVGTVFAVSPDRSTVAYALGPQEVQAVLQAPRQPGTGECV